MNPRTVKCVQCGTSIKRAELPRKCKCGSSMALLKLGRIWRRCVINWTVRA